MRPRFGGEQATTMQILKIAKRKFVMRLRVDPVTSIDREVPFSVMLGSAKTKKLSLSRGGRLIVRPSAFFVRNKVSSLNELPRKLHCGRVHAGTRGVHGLRSKGA